MENEVVVKSLTNNYPETDPVVIHHTPGCLAKGFIQNTQHNTTQHKNTMKYTKKSEITLHILEPLQTKKLDGVRPVDNRPSTD